MKVFVSIIPQLLINLQVGFSLDRYLMICHPLKYDLHKRHLTKWIVVTCVILAVITQFVDLIIDSLPVSHAITSLWTVSAISLIAVMFTSMKFEISKWVRV